MANIFIVRHGQDEDNAAGILNGRRDMPLTELGHKQAKIAGEKLKDNKIDVIYCSPLQRTRQTAEIIGKEIGINNVITLDDLVERNFGVMTGKPVADIPKYAGNKVLKTEHVLYFLEVEGSETFPQVLARAKRVLDWVQAKHPAENVLLATHGDLGKMIRAAFHGWTWEKGLLHSPLDNSEVLELFPGKEDVIE
jgi:broad specificity phosphatase PhoE